MSALERDEGVITAAIKNHIDTNGGNYPAWYVGIARNPIERLFKDHNVDKARGIWIYRDAGSRAVAERIEMTFIRLGIKGNPGGGSEDTTWVYAYKIEPYTRE